jgi:hypothetical protein
VYVAPKAVVIGVSASTVTTLSATGGDAEGAADGTVGAGGALVLGWTGRTGCGSGAQARIAVSEQMSGMLA